MKSILLSGTAAMLLLTATGAFAQPDQHQNDNHSPAATHAGDQHMSGDAHMSGPADQHGTMAPAHTTTTHTTTHRTRYGHQVTTHKTSTTTTNNSHGDNYGHNDAAVHISNGAHHANFDVKFRITLNAGHHFHAPAYRAPHGYVYRRYNVGQRLEPAFYARDYWLSDYATYDLMAPPDGYTWVRFGPDAMLIDEDTGEVVRVVYGVFI